MSDTRDRIIETTASLLEAQGYSATGLNQIVTESDTPKGSLYYYFPGGKDELVAAAIRRTATIIEGRIRTQLATQPDAADAVRGFLTTLAQYVEAADFCGGGPITAVALETAATSEQINAACQAAYDAWQAAFAEKLHASGIAQARAERLGRMIVASIEGATILSRTYHSTTPLHDAAEELYQLVRLAEPAT